MLINCERGFSLLEKGVKNKEKRKARLNFMLVDWI